MGVLDPHGHQVQISSKTHLNILFKLYECLTYVVPCRGASLGVLAMMLIHHIEWFHIHVSLDKCELATLMSFCGSTSNYCPSRSWVMTMTCHVNVVVQVATHWHLPSNNPMLLQWWNLLGLCVVLWKRECLVIWYLVHFRTLSLISTPKSLIYSST